MYSLGYAADTGLLTGRPSSWSSFQGNMSASFCPVPLLLCSSSSLPSLPSGGTITRMPPATSSQPPVIVEQPLLNSIPEDLVSRFDPVFVQYWSKYNAGRYTTHQIPIEEYRSDPQRYTIGYGREIVDTQDLIITEEKCPVGGGEITIRVFQPSAVSSGQTPRPVYINYHGGGWVYGGLANDNDFCKRLALETGCVAFDVDYRLAPEYKFPIPVDDCFAALKWVSSCPHQGLFHRSSLTDKSGAWRGSNAIQSGPPKVGCRGRFGRCSSRCRRGAHVSGREHTPGLPVPRSAGLRSTRLRPDRRDQTGLPVRIPVGDGVH